MSSHGYPTAEISDALGVSANTVKLWVSRHKAGEGFTSRPYPKLTALPVGTTQAGCVVAALDGWFTPAEAKLATGVSDNTALLKIMSRAGVVEKQGQGPATRYRSLATPREWLNRRNVMEGAYPFEKEWPISCDFAGHLARTPPSNAPGIDFAAPGGTPILAIAAGIIRGVRLRPLGGRSLWIDHGDRHQSYYAHLRCLCALNGERVEQGDVIGHVGSTGHSSGNHLHLSCKRGSVWLDPELVLSVSDRS
jgi:hypothetical protein